VERVASFPTSFHTVSSTLTWQATYGETTVAKTAVELALVSRYEIRWKLGESNFHPLHNTLVHRPTTAEFDAMCIAKARWQIYRGRVVNDVRCNLVCRWLLLGVPCSTAHIRTHAHTHMQDTHNHHVIITLWYRHRRMQGTCSWNAKVTSLLNPRTGQLDCTPC